MAQLESHILVNIDNFSLVNILKSLFIKKLLVKEIWAISLWIHDCFL